MNSQLILDLKSGKVGNIISPHLHIQVANAVNYIDIQAMCIQASQTFDQFDVSNALNSSRDLSWYKKISHSNSRPCRIIELCTKPVHERCKFCQQKPSNSPLSPSVSTDS